MTPEQVGPERKGTSVTDDGTWAYNCDVAASSDSIPIEFGDYPVGANYLLLAAYNMAWFWVLGIPFYIMLATLSQLWWWWDLADRTTRGVSAEEWWRFVWINLVIFFMFQFSFWLIWIPGINFGVPIIGFIVYLYVAYA